MEAKHTELSEINSNTENFLVDDEAVVNKSITIYLKNNEKPKHIRKQKKLILIRSTHLKKKQGKYNKMEANIRS